MVWLINVIMKLTLIQGEKGKNRMSNITIKPVTKENWEEALAISVKGSQKEFVPSVAESLAFAYIKPWDEELDPFALYSGDEMIGFFYVSYTPGSKGNYWIGGFQIDKQHQGKGYGRKALESIIAFIKESHPNCEVISLTIEEANKHARQLYEKVGFKSQNKANQYGEFIYKLNV